MCQAYDGVRDYIYKYIRECGYNAQKHGEPISSNPFDSIWERECFRYWEIGWNLANQNHELW
jgi:hypothetical protein